MSASCSRLRLALLALAGMLVSADGHSAPPNIETLTNAPREAFVEATRLAVVESADSALLITRVDPTLEPVINRFIASPEWVALEREFVECLHDRHAAVGETRLLARSIASIYQTTEIIRANPEITMLSFAAGDVPKAFDAAAFSPEEEKISAAAYQTCATEKNLLARMMTPDMMSVVNVLVKRLLEMQGIPSKDLPPDFLTPEMLQLLFAPGTVPK